MEPIRLPKLERDQIGVWNLPGWYLQHHEVNPSKDVVMVQCQFGHSARLPAECAIGRDGVVEPMFKCHCLKFTGMLKLENWPQTFYKLLGKEEVTKFYRLSK